MDGAPMTAPTYPPNWPRCPICDDFALDGHVTCGRVECNESKQRREKSYGRTERKPQTARDRQDGR
jgi:hypothetical protein